MAVPELDDNTTVGDVVSRNTLASVSPLTRPFSNLQKEVTKLKVIALDTLLRTSTHTTSGHLLRRFGSHYYIEGLDLDSHPIDRPTQEGFPQHAKGLFAPDAS